MNILAIDIGGTNIKILATGQSEPRKFPSGSEMTPPEMIEGIKAITGDWKYDAVSIGYPGPVTNGQIAKEPHNLGQGWMGFDFEEAFQRMIEEGKKAKARQTAPGVSDLTGMGGEAEVQAASGKVLSCCVYGPGVSQAVVLHQPEVLLQPAL